MSTLLPLLAPLLVLMVGYLLGQTLERSRWILAARLRRPLQGGWFGPLYWVGRDRVPCERCGCAVLRPDCFCCADEPAYPGTRPQLPRPPPPRWARGGDNPLQPRPFPNAPPPPRKEPSA